MAEQTYALAKSGVYGQANGAYADALTKILDDFEDGDLSEYAGDTGSASVVTSPALVGSHSAQADGASANKAITRTDITVGQGDTIDFRQQYQSTTYGGVGLFCVQSETGYSSLSCYGAGINLQAGEILIRRYDSGSGTVLTSKSVGVSTGTEYRNEVDIADDGTISLTTYKVSDGTVVDSISATDTNYPSGGIGIQTYQAHYIDHFRRL